MRFWCSATEAPWSWAWQAYPGVWLMSLGLGAWYFVSVGDRTRQIDRRKAAFFCFGVAAFWVASDWPLGLLGAGYLASAHMAQFMLYTLAAAPLMLAGMPEWLTRHLASKLRAYRLLRRLSRPVTAGVLFNAVLVATHAPWVTDTLRVNQLGSFVMDLVWLAAGLLVWMPVLSPMTELRMKSRPGTMVYLFASMGVVPAIPAGFLTFATFPLYSTFEIAPRVHGISAIADQQAAGFIMKLAGIPVVWGMIVATMLRWAAESRAADTTTDGADASADADSTGDGTGDNATVRLNSP